MKTIAIIIAIAASVFSVGLKIYTIMKRTPDFKEVSDDEDLPF